MCRPLCQGAAADPDGDGWGWEHMQSCLVQGSPPAVGAVCNLMIPRTMLTEVDDLPSSNDFDNGAIQPPAELPPVFQPGRTAARPAGNESTGFFVLHVYERFSDPPNRPWGSQITTSIERALAGKIPLIVGEFGFQHGDDGMGNPRAVPFDALLDVANRYGIGYLGWSWTGNGEGVEYLDLVDRQTGAFTDWGRDLIEGPSDEIDGIRESSTISSMFMP